MTDRASVCLVGAGPAGALAARRLAGHGHRVVLVARPRTHRPLPDETLVPGAAPAIERAGLQDLFARERWFGTPRHGIIWGDDAVRWRAGGDASRGFQVERATLDAELVRRAGDAGVVLAEAPAPAAVRVLATGKDAPPHGDAVTLSEQLPATVALVGHLEAGGDREATVIEAVPEGWWWWLPLRRGGIALTLFADAGDVRVRGRDAVWRSGRDAAHGPARDAGSRPLSALVATPSLRAAPGDLLLAGDAASAIDPLSSQGLEKAFASSEMVSRVVHTMLARPDDAGRLVAFHQGWERGLYRAHARRALAHYASERRFPDAPFWRARHAAARALLPAPGSDTLPARIRRSDAVRDAELWRPERDDLLRPVAAFRVGADGTPADRIAGVPLGPLLACCAAPNAPDAVCAAAAAQGDLYLASPGSIREALVEALRLGFLSPA